MPMVHHSPNSSATKNPKYLQWFYNLPIRRKQLLGLFASEIISVVGLVGVGTYLIVTGGRQQLLQQVKSEIAVTDIQYNIKINQMGFGFRGQADNAAIISAAQTYQQDPILPSDLYQQIRGILQNELDARDIEYATLVGPDLRVIANAADNRDRRGEVFDPSNLVSTILANPTQIKTSEYLSWQDLQRENPTLPPDFTPQAVLIRYTATPVLDRQTQAVIGVLISGDIVNGKRPIVQQTVTTLNGGYSAIYLVEESQTFTPVALFDSNDMKDSAIEPAPELPKTAALENMDTRRVSDRLLKQAIAAQGAVVTGRDRIGDADYTIAAQALINHAGEPVAVLVRGTSENALNALLQANLSTQLVITMIAIAADIGLAILLGFALIEPTRRLQKTAQSFASGNLKRRAEVFATDEVGQLTVTFNEMADNLVKRYKLEEQVEIQKHLNEQLQQEITERQRTEAALQQSQAELVKNNQLLEQTLQELKTAQIHMVQNEKMSSLGQLVAGVAHEINNPTSFIHGNLPHIRHYTNDLLWLIQLYQQQYPDSNQRLQEAMRDIDLSFIQEDLPKTVESMEVGTRRIRKIVTSLRTFSRCDDSKAITTDIHVGLESTLSLLQHRLDSNHKSKRPEIQVIKDYGNVSPIECYSGPLNQVFMNILANAIDVLEDYYSESSDSKIFPHAAAAPSTTFTEEVCGRITISTQTLSPDWVEIVIADNGPGIPSAIQTKVFEPFFTTKPIGKGTGFGLSISYQIITEKHGGTLDCISSTDQGTMFIIRIPVSQSGDRANPLIAGSPTPTHSRMQPH